MNIFIILSTECFDEDRQLRKILLFSRPILTKWIKLFWFSRIFVSYVRKMKIFLLVSFRKNLFAFRLVFHDIGV